MGDNKKMRRENLLLRSPYETIDQNTMPRIKDILTIACISDGTRPKGVSSTMTKVEMAKHIHFAMWIIFDI